jgi:hypothetical protein
MRQGTEPEGTEAAADAERERQREAAPSRGFLERLFRRTNETGMDPATMEQRRNYLGSGAADTNTSYNKKGGLLKAKAPMKKGGKVMKYREGGMIRQGMQSPKAQEGRAEMAEDVMRRSRAREPISDKERKAGRMEAGMDSGPLTGAEKERMRSSGFKKGGKVAKYEEGGTVRSFKYVDEELQNKAYSPMRAKLGQGLRSPVANRAREKETMQNYGGRPMRSTTRTARELFDNLSVGGGKGGTGFARNAAEQLRKAREMSDDTGEYENYKKGGAVKKAAGGKVAAPKKMMKGGKVAAKPVKKMMGGGRAMYAKGGMAKGCK